MNKNAIFKINNEQVSPHAYVEFPIGDLSKPETLKKLEMYRKKINYISIFNLLHFEKPLKLITTSVELLSDLGKLGITNWINNNTQSGPPLEIRPIPEDIIEWGLQTNLRFIKYIDLPPSHFGLIFSKK